MEIKKKERREERGRSLTMQLATKSMSWMPTQSTVLPSLLETVFHARASRQRRKMTQRMQMAMTRQVMREVGTSHTEALRAGCVAFFFLGTGFAQTQNISYKLLLSVVNRIDSRRHAANVQMAAN